MKDRTREFKQTVSSVRSTRSSHHASSATSRQFHRTDSSLFTQRALAISAGIEDVRSKLEDLAKRTSALLLML